VAARLTGRADAVAPMRAIALNLMLAGDGGAVGMAIPAREGASLRRLFVAPWRGRTLAGTAHYPCDREPASPSELEPYVERFVRELAAAWPARSLTRDDVLLVHSGMQPDLPGHGPPAHRIVDHARDGVPQLLSAIGPKLTTSRAVAEELLDRACARIPLPCKPCETAVRPLASAPAEDCSALVARALAADRAGLPEDVLTHLVRSYGVHHDALLAMVRDEPALAERIDPGSPVIAAQLAYGAREEMAMRGDDLVYRRTELGSTAHVTSHGSGVADAQLRRVESPGGRESRSL
jgi:glycerol-3-phosphate dehydrogenase